MSYSLTETEQILAVTVIRCDHMIIVNYRDVLENKQIECPFCNHYRIWTAFRPVEIGYRIKCNDCTYERHYGVGYVAHRTFASKHAISRHHSVKLYLDGYVNGTTVVGAVPLTDNPPF